MGTLIEWQSHTLTGDSCEENLGAEETEGEVKSKKPAKKVNQFTGRPRRWVCINDGVTDSMLEEIEAGLYYNAAARRSGRRTGWAAFPKEHLLKIAEVKEAQLRFIKEALGDSLLTDSELRYCEAEGIPATEYWARKRS